MRQDMRPLSCSQTFTLLRLGFSGPKIISGPLLCCVNMWASQPPIKNMVVRWPMESWTYCDGKVYLNYSPSTMLSNTMMSWYIHACSYRFSFYCMREIHLPSTGGENGELKFHGITQMRRFLMSMPPFVDFSHLCLFSCWVDSSQRLVTMWQLALMKCSMSQVSNSSMCGSYVVCIIGFFKRGRLHICCKHLGVFCWRPSWTYFHATKMES
jgi:hypothetical protein